MAPLFIVFTRVQWADTDAAGVVWMGTFLRYCELAEDELFRVTGESRLALSRRFDMHMPRVEVAVRFSSPARVEDQLQIGVRPEVVSDRRIKYAFEIKQKDSGDLVATAAYEVACVHRTSFMPRSFPAEIQRQLSDGFTGMLEHSPTP